MKKVIFVFWLMPVMALSQVVVNKPGDIVITEIMADPNPPVRLPSAEYLEIMNRSGSGLSLSGWRLISGTQSSWFPDIRIEQGEYAILCSLADTLLFSSFGKVIGMKSFPALNDAGKLIILTDNTGTMIHFVDYDPEWYCDDLRSGGGWSLEMTDTGYPFFAEGNWKASLSREGGTPGKPNSVEASNPDLHFEGIKNIFPSDSNLLSIEFYEPVADPVELVSYMKTSGIDFKSVRQADLTRRSFEVTTGASLQKGTRYTVTFTEELTDLASNRAERSSFDIGLPGLPGAGDIVFNEILFNPLPGDADYIELYNTSDTAADISQMYLADRDDQSGKTSSLVPVSNERILLMPGEYLAVTQGRTAVLRRYFRSDKWRVLETGSLPSMPDDEGHLLLYGRQLDLIDEVKYDDDMHFSLLSAPEGISLEKVNPHALSSDRNSWHSASGSDGWGTPGTENSVFTELPANSNSVRLSSSRVSPDNDGYEDIVLIQMNFEKTGSVVTATVFDENGYRVRTLAENLLCAPESYISWDATDDAGSVLPRGIYVILVSMFDDKGRKEKWKFACSVLR